MTSDYVDYPLSFTRNTIVKELKSTFEVLETDDEQRPYNIMKMNLIK